jgi:hypothetical protein
MSTVPSSIAAVFRTTQRALLMGKATGAAFATPTAIPIYSYATRSFSSSSSSELVTPILNTDALADRLHTLAPSIASALSSRGFWTNDDENDNDPRLGDVLLQTDDIRAMRNQSIALRAEGRFEQSWSERMNEQGIATRFDKQGVFACEPDGADYETAPDILLYMSTIIATLPALLNEHVRNTHTAKNETAFHDNIESAQHPAAAPLPPPLNLSNQSFNAKLAVTSPGGSTYPLHVDNTLGINSSSSSGGTTTTGSLALPNDDSRKLTCILYLNPDYAPGDGGHLRLLLLDKECLDLDPRGGRMVIFWSDEIPHEVLPTKPEADATDQRYDRYALTIWLPDNDPRNIQAKDSKFESLRVGAFAEGGETWC